MKKCPSCGTDNPDTEKICAKCGAFLQRSDYRASVASGLKRLESEKLSFLGNKQIISKFNPNHVEQFTPVMGFQTDTLENTEFFDDQASVSSRGRSTDSLGNSASNTNSRFQNLRVSGVLTETAIRTAEAIDSLTPTVANQENPEVVTLNFAALRGKSSSENKKVNTSSSPQSRVLIHKSVDPLERPPIKEEMPAVEKLRVQGLFNTLQQGDVIQGPSDVIENVAKKNTSSLENKTLPDVQSENSRETSASEDLSSATSNDSAISETESLSATVNDLHPDNSESDSESPAEPSPTMIMDAAEDLEIAEPRHHLLYIVLLTLILCGIGYLLYITGMLANIHPMLNPWSSVESSDNTPVVVTPAVTPKVDNSREKLRESIQLAAMEVHEVANIDGWFDSWLKEQDAMENDPENKQELYGLAVSLYPRRFSYLQKYAQYTLDAGKIEDARSFMRSLPSADFADPEMRDLYFRSFAEDKYFLPNTLNVTEKVVDEIAPLGGGSTLTFKFLSQGNIVGAFKPHQTRRQSNYLSEIAAWRLCQLLQCDFEIPYNRPVKVERDTFNRLYEKTKSSKKELYRQELVDIIWTKDKATGKSYVYGTLKDWVPEYTRFPIEYLSLWKGWISQEEYVESFPLLKNALFPMTKRDNTLHLYGTVLNQTSNLTTEQLASQISQVLTFDFLIGNWDRFSGVPEWWGVNCQFAKDRIVSIDNGASFPAFSNERVRQKFMYVERFSRHFIDALRSLKKEETFKLLFPDQTSYERANFEQFWKQRSLVLSRIDSLSEKYGTEHVLSFE